jgi:ribonuclease J
MEFLIHRGHDEIGGNCLELRQDGFRLLLDYGQPLPGAEEEPLPPSADVDGVLISHGHSDHHGRLSRLDPQIPVFLSETTRALIQTTRLFLRKDPLENAFKSFEPWKPWTIGPFEVTAFPVDHSFPDSFAFRIRHKDQAVFYSGDLRETGNLGPLTRRLSRKTVGPLEVLFLEGTNLSREEGRHPDEAGVENAMAEGMRGCPGAAFVICSGQNVERLVRAWKAAVKSGRVFVVDLYTAWVMAVVARKFPSIPNPGWHHLRVLTQGETSGSYAGVLQSHPDVFGDFLSRTRNSPWNITEPEILRQPHRCLVKTHPRQISSLLDRLPSPSKVFYSMWTGYLSQESGAESVKVKKNPRVDWEEIHASGHASSAALRRLTTRLGPALLVPIHSQTPDLMKDFGAQVFLPQRGVSYPVGNKI